MCLASVDDRAARRCGIYGVWLAASEPGGASVTSGTPNCQPVPSGATGMLSHVSMAAVNVTQKLFGGAETHGSDAQ